MKKSIQRYIAIILLSIGLITSCGKSSNQNHPTEREPIKVKVLKVLANKTPNSFQTSGVIASDNIVEISAKIMGNIEHLSLDVGDYIKKDAIIAKIKNLEADKKSDQVNSMIEETHVQLKALERDFNRIQRLFNQQSATQKELDDITTAVESTKIKIKQLESSKSEVDVVKSYSMIKAPISGLVTSKFKNSGEMAYPGQPILTIQDDKDAIIALTIPESFIRQVSEGSKVQYKIENENSWNDGVLSDISHAANGGQYPAKVRLPRSNNYLSGMYTDVKITLSDQDRSPDISELILVERNALVKRGQLTGIFIPTDQNTALLRWVILGNDLGDYVEILSGLSENEKYISQPDSRLINGIPITY